MGDRTPVPWRGRLSKAADLSWIHFSIHHRLGCFQKWLDGRTTDFFTSIFLVLLACLPRFACLLAALPRVALPLIDSFLPSFLSSVGRSVGFTHSSTCMFIYAFLCLTIYLKWISVHVLTLSIHPLSIYIFFACIFTHCFFNVRSRKDASLQRTYQASTHVKPRTCKSCLRVIWECTYDADKMIHDTRDCFSLYCKLYSGGTTKVKMCKSTSLSAETLIGFTVSSHHRVCEKFQGHGTTKILWRAISLVMSKYLSCESHASPEKDHHEQSTGPKSHVTKDGALPAKNQH